jgi:hypothetical protein
MSRDRHRFFPERLTAGPFDSGAVMNASTTTVATTAVQITRAETGLALSLAAEFRYSPADPFAMTMVIESVTGPAHWTFARDLILNGQFEPTCDGDVHVWPCLDIEGAAVVIIELHSFVGRTLLQFPSRTVREFVSASLGTVPEGAEHYHVDGWIEQLLVDTDVAPGAGDQPSLTEPE